MEKELEDKTQTVNTQLIYLLYSDQDYTYGITWAENLGQELSLYDYKLHKFNSIDSFINALKQNKPLALIVNFDFIFNSFDLNSKEKTVLGPLVLSFSSHYTIFINKSGQFEKRLDAFRMGCKNFLLLPFPINELVIELDNIKYQWTGEFKALIVDDDQDILSYFSTLLSQARINNKTIQSYNDLETQLHDFQPDILLLDLNMPGCNGIELAGVVRQQNQYEHIPIIYLSAEKKESIQLEAMSVGADDYISKSANPAYLIQIIRARANRYKKLRQLITRDITGAFNFDYISNEIDKHIQLNNKKDYNLTIGILKINNLGMVKNSYGFHASDQLLKSLVILLKNSLDPSRIVGRYTSNKFIIIFPKTTIEEATNEMQKIQTKFQSTLQYANEKAFSSTFSIAFETYHEGSIKKFIDRANQKLLHHKKNV